MNKEVLNKTVEVENDLIIITEETKTTKDRNILEGELISIQRRITSVTERNKSLLDEYTQLRLEEQAIKDMIAQLPQDLQIIG